eukprot:168621-Rhodomonas_salina.4
MSVPQNHCLLDLLRQSRALAPCLHLTSAFSSSLRLFVTCLPHEVRDGGSGCRGRGESRRAKSERGISNQTNSTTSAPKCTRASASFSTRTHSAPPTNTGCPRFGAANPET